MTPRRHSRAFDGERVNHERNFTLMLKSLPLSKLLLSLAAVCVIAVGAVGGTFANFTATPTTIASNAFASGSLTMSRTGSGAIFNASAMKIGDTATGLVTITNTGTLAGAYALSGSTSGSSVLTGQLNLKIYKDVDGGSAIYDGALGSLSSASLGTFAANGDAHTFYFHISFPSTGTDAGDNALQGLSASTTFTWTATQA
jgi:spore coat-associated protein N